MVLYSVQLRIMAEVKKYVLYSLLLALVFVSGNLAQAQGMPGSDGLNMQVSPSAPAPNSQVSFALTNYSINLQTSDIRWLVNGKQASRGAGFTSFTTVTGAPGSVLTISVIVTTTDGQTLTKEITLRPALLDLIWQADSAVPPLYRGKALPTTKNLVKFVAIPHFVNAGVEIDQSKLVYQWSLEFDPTPTGSGLGKNTFSTKIVDLIGETRVGVKVSTLDGSIVASKSLAVSPFNPLVSLVRIDDLEGPDLAHPLSGNYDLTGPEVTLRTVGYYFPKSHVTKPGLKYSFAVNGKPAMASEVAPALLTLRQGPGTGSGQAALSAAINDSFDSMISAVRSITLTFGSNSLQ